jgi:decaprenylphospho-beta-D-ribofuranose 2-oxidase
MAVGGLAHVVAPRDAEELASVFELARATNRSIAPRGAGCSYGDAATNTGGIVLDLTRMNRILSWDPEAGIMECEPGVTIEQVWKRTLPDGWWPHVVSGTMFTTMGGCAAMNVHGKNNWCVGPFGEHILEFEILLPTGELLTCSPTHNSDLFHAAISGFGMLGVMTRLRLKMKRIYSGHLWVEAFLTPDIAGMIDGFEDHADESDYLVGWLDALCADHGLGRGIVHRASYRPEGEDLDPRSSLTVGAQQLPDKILGLFPKSMVWWPLSFLVNRPGMRVVNALKMHSAHTLGTCGQRYLESHAGFAFLLDYVPNWKRAYRPGGLIQYQSFIPRANAEEAFTEILQRARRAGLPPYLSVFKKHRPDAFLISHGLDGYSLALDFRVTERNRNRLWHLCEQLDEVVFAAGGRFYFAKDATLRPDRIPRFLGEETMAEFGRLKARCDPEGILQSDLARRLFAPEAARIEDFAHAG